jgi:hypothetical protein
MIRVSNYFVWTAFAAMAFACGPEGSKDEADEATVQEHIHTPVVPTDEITPKSPRLTTMENIGDVHVHIDYSAPSVRGRNVWGGLVAYGEVWVTGAHRATSIEFSDDVKIEGKHIPAGKYALFTIPGEEEWTIILNTNWEQHLADAYTASEDVARFSVSPEKLDEPQEQLRYEIHYLGENTGRLLVKWENIQVPLRIEEA